MLKDSISFLLKEIRQDLGYVRGNPPVIVDVFEHKDNGIHVVVSDRAEKSLMIGPRGRIAAELSKKLERNVSFYSGDELLLRKYRLDLTLNVINAIYEETSPRQKEFLTFLIERIRNEKNFPEYEISDAERNQSHAEISVAFSGGVDSGATLILASRCFSNVESLTADLGPRFIDRRELKRIETLCSQLEVQNEIVTEISGMENVIQRTESKAIHPCGECHDATMSAIKKVARERKADVLLTGEMLPTGRQSIELDKDLLIVHLPAALAWSKYRTKMTYFNETSATKSDRFGCHFLAGQHSQGWKYVGPSIFRVLRELQGGVLTTGESLNQIKSILFPYLRDRKNEDNHSSLFREVS